MLHLNLHQEFRTHLEHGDFARDLVAEVNFEFFVGVGLFIILLLRNRTIIPSNTVFNKKDVGLALARERVLDAQLFDEILLLLDLLLDFLIVHLVQVALNGYFRGDYPIVTILVINEIPRRVKYQRIE